MKTTFTSTVQVLSLTAAGVGLLGGLAGCRGDREDKPPRQFFPDMDDAPKWKSQSKSEFFVDGRTMRQPVPGTVPFSNVPISATTLANKPEWAAPFLEASEDYLRADKAYFEGVGEDGTYLDVMPASVKVDKALLLRGQDRFNIYCAVCHGKLGDGKGMVGQQWSYAVPSFHDPKYTDLKQNQGKDGYLFHTARNGVPAAVAGQAAKMPGYAHALSVKDSWAVIAYIRALQETEKGTAADIPTAEREALEQKRVKPAPKAPDAAPAAPATTGGKQ